MKVSRTNPLLNLFYYPSNELLKPWKVKERSSYWPCQLLSKIPVGKFQDCTFGSKSLQLYTIDRAIEFTDTDDWLRAETFSEILPTTTSITITYISSEFTLYTRFGFLIDEYSLNSPWVLGLGIAANYHIGRSNLTPGSAAILMCLFWEGGYNIGKSFQSRCKILEGNYFLWAFDYSMYSAKELKVRPASVGSDEAHLR